MKSLLAATAKFSEINRSRVWWPPLVASIAPPTVNLSSKVHQRSPKQMCRATEEVVDPILYLFLYWKSRWPELIARLFSHQVFLRASWGTVRFSSDVCRVRTNSEKIHSHNCRLYFPTHLHLWQQRTSSSCWTRSDRNWGRHRGSLIFDSSSGSRDSLRSRSWWPQDSTASNTCTGNRHSTPPQTSAVLSMVKWVQKKY